MTAATRKTLMDELREERARNSAFDARYQRDLARLPLANQIAQFRERAGLSQAALAARIGTRQAGVARMEPSAYRGYTVGTLAKIAAATGATLDVRLIPARRPRQRE